jgi:outer membrane protein OmpA-like peptidoglycan-associated protein
VGGVSVFSETSSGTAKCAAYGNKENSRNITVPIATAVATSNSAIPVVIEMSGDQYIGIDDIYITSGPSGGASSNPDQTNIAWQLDPSDSSGKRYFINVGTLAVGEVVTVTFTAAIPANIGGGGLASVSNTASVISTQQTTPTAAVVSTPFAISQFALTKTASVAKVLSGGSVTYTYSVKNNGDLASTSNVIVDDNGTPDNTADDVTVSTVASASLVKTGGTGATATDGNLDPGETWTYSRTVSGVTSDITDTATYTGQTTDSTPTDTDATTVLVVAPSFTLTVDHATHYIRTGETAEFYYTVTNTGNDALTDLNVTPPYCKTFVYQSGDLDSDGVLDGLDGEHLVAESWIYKCVTDVLTTSQTGGSATAAATSNAFGSNVNATPIAIAITVISPALSITKLATNTAATQAGSTSAFSNVDPTNSVNRKVVDPSNSISYTYVVTNTGDASLTGVSVVDSECANPVYPSGKSASTTMAPSAAWTFTCDAVTKSQSVRGIAYANALDPMGDDVQSNAVSLYIKVLAPHLLLNVTSATEYVKYGSSTTFTYTVTNDGEVVVGSFDITPGVCTPLVGPVQGAGSTNGNLEIGEVWTYTCTMSNITTDPLNTFEISNVKDGGGSSTGYTPAPSVVKVFVVDPTMTVVQKVSVYAAGVLMAGPALDVPAELGDTIKYTYEIASSNTVHGSSIGGLNTMLINSISDAQCSPIEAVDVDRDGFNDGDTNTDGQVDPNETWAFSCTTTQPTQTAQVVDAQATVSAASVVESFTLRPASVRVRVAGALPVAPPSGGSYTINGPGLAPEIQAPPGTYAKKLTLKVYFKGDSAKLIAATKAKIAAFVKQIKAAGGTPAISVIGKVKETADKSYDIRLSTQRAVNVANQMKRLKALGTYKTVAAGISPENKAISRRVEITAIWPKTATK